MQEDTENRQDNGAADQAPEEEVAAQEAAPEETAEEAPAAEVAEEPAAEPAEEPAAEAAEEGGAAAPPPAEAEQAEPAEQLSPKQRRRQARSRASGPPGPERSIEDRARERAEARASKAAARTRWRAKRREKRAAAGGTAARAPQDSPTREPGNRKIRQGIVVSSKGDKTITVRTDAVTRHRVYGKVIRKTNTLHAHDETNQAGEGDVVRVMECRPLSRTKHWRLIDVLEKAR
jgi:small subunit ribosomal protein S17